MKLILSRKGFDSSAGGVASPILPNGRLVSLPIPDPAAPVRYRDLVDSELAIGAMVQDLSRGKVKATDRVHLDPDLDPASLSRPLGWRPQFGQMGAAEGHLRSHQVGPGDVFLFFGWFREVARKKGVWIYKKGAPDQHILFGWMQVANRIPLTSEADKAPPWTHRHPHFFGGRGVNNALYLAGDHLQLPGSKLSLAGGGTFRQLHPSLVLTRTGKSRCHWQLPSWFHPEGRRSCLSYHERPSRWQKAGDWVQVHSVARGQEFVLDLDHYPEAFPWLNALLENA